MICDLFKEEPLNKVKGLLVKLCCLPQNDLYEKVEYMKGKWVPRQGDLF